MRREMLANNASDKGLISKIHKKLNKFYVIYVGGQSKSFKFYFK